MIQQTKHISLTGCSIILVCFVFRSGRRRGWQNTTLSDEHGVSLGWGGRRLEALQELLSHHAGKEGDERWNLCLSWQAGTVTMAQIAPAPRKLQQTAGRRGKKQAETRAMQSLLFPVPVPVPDPDPDSQSASMPSGTHRWFSPRWMWV